MKLAATMLSLLFVLTVAAGCSGPTPEKVCDHMIGLMKKDMGDKFDDKASEAFKKKCVEDGNKEKEKDGAKFEKMAKCALEQGSFEDLRKNCDDDKK